MPKHRLKALAENAKAQAEEDKLKAEKERTRLNNMASTLG